MRLSRMLNDPGRVRPIEWRQEPAALRGPPPVADDPAAAEISRLQEQMRQAVVSAEQQARQEYENGFRAGEVAAKAEAEETVQAAVARYVSAIADLAAARGETIRRAEADTVRLAIEIARRILHRELTMDTSALESLIRAALEKLQALEVHRVRIHPELEKVVRDCLERTGREDAIEVIKDPIQPRGGVIFEISRGALDASVDTQLSEIERGLTERLEERP
jgi:flagellar assembly protein FliH